MRGGGAEPMVVDIKMMEEHHGYSGTDNILHVVYNYRRRLVGPVDRNVYSVSGFGVLNAKQMVLHSPKNLQPGHLLVPRVV
jgi:hypothetical protein